MMGGPRSASRWGLLLRMEDDDVLGGVVVIVGGAEVLDWVKPVSSWVGGGPVYGGLSKSPPNSISWLEMSWSMSKEGEKPQPTSLKLTMRRKLQILGVNSD